MALASMLDRAQPDDQAVFVIKGDVAIELRFALRARATRDLDAVCRGGWDAALETLDAALRAGYGDFTATRSAIEAVGPTRATRAAVSIAYRGRPWATVPLELSPVEGTALDDIDHVPALSLDDLGLEIASRIPCLAVRFQIAQKFHACTAPATDERPNERFRDVIDLLLLRELVTDADLRAVRSACVETFVIRAAHVWPPRIEIASGWTTGHADLAGRVGAPITEIGRAVDELQVFVELIDTAGV